MASSPTTRTIAVEGPWSLATSRRFWEGFAPVRLTGQRDDDVLRATFLAEEGWTPVAATVRQTEAGAEIAVTGAADPDAAVLQLSRVLAIDVDGRPWPDVAERDPVIAELQKELPGLRPCGFYSPYEAAVWSVLSQRIRMTQAGALRTRIAEQHGTDGAFPAPDVLRRTELDLPGRKAEYLRAVAEAALEGRLLFDAIRDVEPADAVRQLQDIHGIGPFAAELIVLRGANAPDGLPAHERRLEREVAERYGPDAELAVVSERWRPLRTWAAVHLRAAAELDA